MGRARLIEHRPPIKPGDDGWMLDLWAASEVHVVGVVYRDLTMSTRRYRTACACGWRSEESDLPMRVDCPVQLALADRLRRIVKFADGRHRRPLEHVKWLPLDNPATTR
jgi:hypothetical protein